MDMSAFVSLALDEDIGAGDLTTDACIDPNATATAYIHSKQELVVAGHAVAAEVFKQLAQRQGTTVSYEVVVPDGTAVADRTVVARLAGHSRTLLTGERLALNFLMKLCGIATNVRPYVEAAQGKLRVVDTRKTTPLLRAFEKDAVRAGGAHNHRFALYDGMMVKDNHIEAAGSLAAAVAACREHAHHLVRVEVEVEDLTQLDVALDTAADVILLDNMDDTMLKQAVAIARARKPQVVLEASGNVTVERIERIRDFGLDVVSSGGLIHQARWVDLSLEIEA